MEKINVYEVSKKLLGPIDPQGESHTDSFRLENLENTIKVTEQLIDDIINVSNNKDRYESSMKIAGDKANNFLIELFEKIEWQLKFK